MANKIDYTKIKVVEEPELSKPYDKRYVIIDAETGKVLDDAQGYGFKDAQKAYKCYAYKNRDRELEKKVKKWKNQHKDVIEDYEYGTFMMMKYSNEYTEEEKNGEQLILSILERHNINPDELGFTIKDFLKIW